MDGIALMEKIDSLTPWHVLQCFAADDKTLAFYTASRYAKERGDKPFPQYSVLGRTF